MAKLPSLVVLRGVLADPGEGVFRRQRGQELLICPELERLPALVREGDHETPAYSSSVVHPIVDTEDMGRGNTFLLDERLGLSVLDA